MTSTSTISHLVIGLKLRSWNPCSEISRYMLMTDMLSKRKSACGPVISCLRLLPSFRFVGTISFFDLDLAVSSANHAFFDSLHSLVRKIPSKEWNISGNAFQEGPIAQSREHCRSGSGHQASSVPIHSFEYRMLQSQVQSSSTDLLTGRCSLCWSWMSLSE